MINLKIKKILVPVDFTKTSEIITAEAVTFARLLKAELILIHVIEANQFQFAIVPETTFVIPSLQEIEKHVERKMTKLQEKIEKNYGIKPKTQITSGYTHTEIVNFSREANIDLIMMGTHGASKYKEMFVGTNAQRVVTLSDIPVLTMQRRKRKEEFKNILIPIDNSLHSREKVHLAMIIADLFGSVIHIIGLPDSKAKKEVEKFKIKLESVEEIVKSDNLPYKTTIVHGRNLAKSAINYASKNKCDLIVINTGHESKLTGMFLGAFAQQIVNYSKIPVLSFKHSHGHYSIDTPGYGIS